MEGVLGVEPRRSRVKACRVYRFRHTPTRWSWQRDSNPQPAVYKTAALPVEPYQRSACPERKRGSGTSAVRACARACSWSPCRRMQGRSRLFAKSHHGRFAAPQVSRSGCAGDRGCSPATAYGRRERTVTPAAHAPLETLARNGAAYRTRTGVNYSPPAWKAGALPPELKPREVVPGTGIEPVAT